MSDASPSIGTTVRFEVDLKTVEQSSSPLIQVRGQVSRIQPSGECARPAGFAVSTGKMRLYKRP